jgi:hypothetical protein
MNNLQFPAADSGHGPAKDDEGPQQNEFATRKPYLCESKGELTEIDFVVQLL